VSKPRIAISMGDPTGIGPEVTLQALAELRIRRRLTPILVGDIDVYRETAAALHLPLRFVASNDGSAAAQRIPIVPVARLLAKDRRAGRPSHAGGRAAYDAIREAVRLVTTGFADALVTAPICKANLAAAGTGAEGHTELLAKLTKSDPVRMMMVGDRLRVVLVTTHVSIARLPKTLSRRLVLDTIMLAHATLKERFALSRPRIAVTGLNPHAGEGGLFGDEEARIIAPAVREAARKQICVSGPLAADSVFPHAVAGDFDAVVCMYHDQALAPFKLLHFADGVNFTIGLPFVRTSPDHGTAHDIAGRGKADPGSMIAALALAAKLIGKQSHHRARRAA
jgi:4-hydroxythreonine-4-phosphate dehydrogenase